MGAERMSGLVAGDEESYTAFQRLFDPVIEKLHPPFRRTPAHLADRHVRCAQLFSLHSFHVQNLMIRFLLALQQLQRQAAPRHAH